MSDLFAKKPSGKPDKKADKTARRQARSKEQQKTQRKTKIIAIAVTSVFLLLFIGSFVLNSGIFARSVSVMNIGGVGFSAAEFDYYYNVTVASYAQMVEEQMGEYASMMLPTRDLPFSEQVYDPETGQSWADFFMDSTLSHLSEVVQIFNAGKANGFVLPSDDIESISSDIDLMSMQVQMWGYASLDQYLRHSYGPNMNKAAWRDILEFTAYVQSYEASVAPEFDFTQAELTAFYDENRDTLDVFNFLVFTVYPDEVLDWEYETDEEYEAAREAAFEVSRVIAREIAEGIITEEDFAAAALDYDPLTYDDPDSMIANLFGEWMTGPMLDWLLEEPRVYGDVGVVDSEPDLTYIVFFQSRDDNDYQIAGMRQLLIMRDELFPEDFDDEAMYAMAFASADSVARERAEELLQIFNNSGANEDAMAAIVEDNPLESLDGSLYEFISKASYQSAFQEDVMAMKVVPEIEEWLFDPDRRVGDSELIYTQAYGYHLVYFTGLGEHFNNFIAKDRLLMTKMDEAYGAWKESLEPVSAKKGFFFSFFTNTG